MLIEFALGFRRRLDRVGARCSRACCTPANALRRRRIDGSDVLNLFEGSCDVDQLEQLETNDWTLVRGFCLVTNDYRQTDDA
jgi:hypothetical protein